MPILQTPQPGNPIRAFDMAALIESFNAGQFAGFRRGQGPGLLKTCAQASGYNGGTVRLFPGDVAICSGLATTDSLGSGEIVMEIRQAIPDDNFGHGCVCIENIGAGEVGQVIVSGSFWVNANAATYGAFGTPIQGSSVLALSDMPGPFQILGGSGTGLVLARFPLPAVGDHWQYLVANSRAVSYLPAMT